MPITRPSFQFAEDVTDEMPANYIPDGTRLDKAFLALFEPLTWYTRELNAKIAQLEGLERRGRKQANSDEVLTEIARAYHRTLEEMPDSSKTGTFYALASEITGLDDPRRQVETAVEVACTKITSG